MDNSEMARARISFELPEYCAPHMIDYLSQLTMTSEIDVEYLRPESHTREVLDQKNLNGVDPGYYTIIWPDTSEQAEAVITLNNFRRFSSEHHGSRRGVMTRVFSAIMRASARKHHDQTTGEEINLREYIYQGVDRYTGNKVTGLSISKLGELCDLLQAGRLRIKGISDYSAGFLLRYYEVLHTGDKLDNRGGNL